VEWNPPSPEPSDVGKQLEELKIKVASYRKEIERIYREFLL